MEKNRENDEITIDLSELFMALWHKAHIIVLAGIAAALLAFIATKLFMTPMYTSETQMYVLSKQDGNANVTYSDLQTGTQLTKDYMELVKTDPVLEKVISETGIDMTIDELKGHITVTTPTDTRITTIAVENEDPKKAKEIANSLRVAVGEQIVAIMAVDAVNTVAEASLPTHPSSPSTMKNTAIGGILGILIAIGVIVLIFVLDDTIKTPEDVEYYLQLNVLASLPIKEGTAKTKKSKSISRKSYAKSFGKRM